jgi:AcrR family transcriptional regulator
MPEDPKQQLPVTERGRATRDRIVSCAAELVLRHGVSSLSLDKVRQAASVSGSQLTYYFDDKDALIRAVVIRQTEVLLDFHRQPALGNLDSFEDFEKWVELTLKFSLRKVRGQGLPTYGVLAGQLSKHDEATHELLADGYRQWLAMFRRGLARMKKNGLLIEAAAPTALANILVSAHEGGNQMTFAYGKTWPDRDALNFALAYLRQFAARPQDRLPLTSGTSAERKADPPRGRQATTKSRAS